MTKNFVFCYDDIIKQENLFLENKDNIGICINGGGFRSTILTMGWIFSLKKIIPYDKIKYISLTSGSSWFYLLYLHAEEYNIKFNNVFGQINKNLYI